MFGFLKNLLRKLVETPVENEELTAPEFEPAPEPTGWEAQPEPDALRPHQKAVCQNGKGVELSLEAVLRGLPLELQPRIRSCDVRGLSILIPLDKILAQLGRGAVKLSFGELRHAAPGVFSPENDRDRVMVPLPLEEILAQINPALIARRRVQRQVQVPEDISSPFDAHGQGLVLSVSAPKAAPAPVPVQAQAPAPAPVLRPASPLPPPPARGMITSAQTPPPPSAQPLAAPAMIPAPRALREISSDTTHVVPAPAPQPVPKAATPIAPEGDTALVVSLSALAEAWPEALRKEIVQSNLVDAKVALPAEAVDQGMRQGRIGLSWKTLRSWIKGARVLETSAQDNTVVDLPLQVITPLFLERQRQAHQLRPKVAIDAEIPNLFFGFPQAEAASTDATATTEVPAANVEDTNYYIWDDASDRARVDEDLIKRRPSLGTQFVARYATPNEVVSRAAALDGVAGALIALPDGLMVASQLSPDLNGDTLAAFLPQIFGKVSACTKELRMGELNNLNFTVGNVPWKIFRVNAIFFAAFGRAGEALPTAQLSALAVELDHKAK